MMKEAYQSPEMETSLFEAEDIIVTSGSDFNPDEDELPP